MPSTHLPAAPRCMCGKGFRHHSVAGPAWGMCPVALAVQRQRVELRRRNGACARWRLLCRYKGRGYGAGMGHVPGGACCAATKGGAMGAEWGMCPVALAVQRQRAGLWGRNVWGMCPVALVALAVPVQRAGLWGRNGACTTPEAHSVW